MADNMMFPSKWEKFIEDYSFNDREEVYTNNSELVPVFRVEQMVEHYFQNRWIPVTERLPEKMKEVLVWSHGGDFAEVAFWEGRRWEKTWDHEVIYTVTHWMPLPTPPQQERKDENEPKE